ncbi:MAG: hypothetical protein AAF493_23165 [Pseudomonadota bacterium]
MNALRRARHISTGITHDARLALRRLRARVGHQPNAVLSIEIAQRIGFFAQLNWCLWIYFFCHAHQLRADIRLTRTYLEPAYGPNWFDYYFENRSIAEPTIATARRITDLAELGLPAPNDNRSVTFELAHSLWTQYASVRPEFSQIVDRFFAQHIQARRTLGLHYRGSDKLHGRKPESPPVSPEEFCHRVRTRLDQDGHFKVLLVASDEPSFYDTVANAFPDLTVLANEDYQKADGKIGVHKREHGSPYLRGVDALVNCLLLSRCDALLKMPSFLSGWAKIFNPSLDTRMVTRPLERFSWFPDRDIAS